MAAVSPAQPEPRMTVSRMVVEESVEVVISDIAL
jgi:hypothetical protein